MNFKTERNGTWTHTVLAWPTKPFYPFKLFFLQTLTILKINKLPIIKEINYFFDVKPLIAWPHILALNSSFLVNAIVAWYSAESAKIPRAVRILEASNVALESNDVTPVTIGTTANDKLSFAILLPAELPIKSFSASFKKKLFKKIKIFLNNPISILFKMTKKIAQSQITVKYQLNRR